MPERKFGSEALEASAKLRKSSIDCLSGASFEATRSEQLRHPAEGPLKRRDGSSCRITFFLKEPEKWTRTTCVLKCLRGKTEGLSTQSCRV